MQKPIPSCFVTGKALNPRQSCYLLPLKRNVMTGAWQFDFTPLAMTINERHEFEPIHSESNAIRLLAFTTMVLKRVPRTALSPEGLVTLFAKNPILMGHVTLVDYAHMPYPLGSASMLFNAVSQFWPHAVDLIQTGAITRPINFNNVWHLAPLQFAAISQDAYHQLVESIKLNKASAAGSTAVSEIFKYVVETAWAARQREEQRRRSLLNGDRMAGFGSHIPEPQEGVEIGEELAWALEHILRDDVYTCPVDDLELIPAWKTFNPHDANEVSALFQAVKPCIEFKLLQLGLQANNLLPTPLGLARNGSR